MRASGADAGGSAFWLVPAFFFFQAEDGIRDLTVTGVQTCALPISCRPVEPLVLMPVGRPMSSHNACTAFATVTTSVNGASFGSRSRMHQSGASSVSTRDDQTWSRMAAMLAM